MFFFCLPVLSSAIYQATIFKMYSIRHKVAKRRLIYWISLFFIQWVFFCVPMKFRQQKDNMPPFKKAYAFSDLEILIFKSWHKWYRLLLDYAEWQKLIWLASTMAIQFSLQTSLPLLSFRYLGLNPGYTLESPGELLKSTDAQAFHPDQYTLSLRRWGQALHVLKLPGWFWCQACVEDHFLAKGRSYPLPHGPTLCASFVCDVPSYNNTRSVQSRVLTIPTLQIQFRCYPSITSFFNA